MNQVIGILIILSMFGIFLFDMVQKKEWKIPFIPTAFFCIVGIVLIISDRLVEIKFKDYFTFKATVKQAQTDAKEISEIKKRVEAQAATIDLVAKESSDAKKLIDDLAKQNDMVQQKFNDLTKQASDLTSLVEIEKQKLNDLKKRTSELGRLPDGRTTFGNMVVGRPSTFLTIANEGQDAYRDKKYHIAYEKYTEALEMYYQSISQYPNAGVRMINGQIDTMELAMLESNTAIVAFYLSNFREALQHCRKSFKLNRNPFEEARLVLFLKANNLRDEAETILIGLKNKNDDYSKKFFQTLDDMSAQMKRFNNDSIDEQSVLPN